MRWSREIAAILHSEFALMHEPVPATVEVWRNARPQREGWWLARDSVVISDPLEPGELLEVSYKTGETRELPLSEPALPESLTVTIADTASPPENFVYDPSGPRLRFRQPLPDGVAVVVEYLENVPLPQRFAFQRLTAGPVTCYLDGERLVLTYIPEGPEVVFPQPPPDGAQILCQYPGSVDEGT